MDDVYWRLQLHQNTNLYVSLVILILSSIFSIYILIGKIEYPEIDFNGSSNESSIAPAISSRLNEIEVITHLSKMFKTEAKEQPKNIVSTLPLQIKPPSNKESNSNRYEYIGKIKQYDNSETIWYFKDIGNDSILKASKNTSLQYHVVSEDSSFIILKAEGVIHEIKK